MELREIYEPIKGDLIRVKKEISEQLSTEDKFIKRVLQDVTNSSGKLLRPALALLAFSTGKNSEKDKNGIIKVASLIELVHTATLIHDDVIDQTTFRRYKPTLHRKWGDKVSVLLGDYLLSRSFTMLSQLGYPGIISALADTMRLICEGELRQIERAYDWDLSEQDYLAIIKKKTASLFSFSSLSGGYLGNAEPSVIPSLANYGLNFGIAFQIVDDCLDLVADEKVVGKSLGSDLRKGKVTLPLIYLLSLAPAPTREKITELLSCERIGEGIPIIREMLQKYQVMQHCAKRIVRHMARAKKEAKEIDNKSIRRSLMELCDYALVKPLESFGTLDVK